MSTTYSVYNSWKQKQEAEYTTKWNMAIQQRQADIERMTAERAIEQKKRQDIVEFGKQRLAFGLSGASASSGSLLESQLQTREEMAYTTAYMEWQKQTGSETAMTDIATTRLYGKQKEKAIKREAVGNVLGAVSQAAKSYGGMMGGGSLAAGKG